MSDANHRVIIDREVYHGFMNDNCNFPLRRTKLEIRDDSIEVIDECTISVSKGMSIIVICKYFKVGGSEEYNLIVTPEGMTFARTYEIIRVV